jgi:hypothetical protein
MFDKKQSQAPQNGDSDQQAKLDVLKELRSMAMEMMGDKMQSHFPGKDIQEVTVAAPDREGLEQGLEVAKDLSADAPSQEESDLDDDMDLEEIEALIRDLEEKRREKLAQA